jgi:hypothetical protein
VGWVVSESATVVLLDHVQEVLAALDKLVTNSVLVGIPAEHADRREGGISNAALGYIFEHGEPSINMPARPSLIPGVKAVQPQTIDGFKKAAGFALEGREGAVERELHRIGLTAQNSVRAIITAGIAPELAPSTIKGRIRRVKGKQRRAKIDAQLAAGVPASAQDGAAGVFTPLIITGAFLHSVSYVIRGPHGTD